jgi:Zn-dependent protease
MEEISPVFYIIILIMSVVIHEIAHGYAALRFGDRTAELSGRLTLNPFKHLDLYGSIILPALLVITKAPFMIGWAKPVPYNPENFEPSKRRIATIWVASAGILTNLSIAILFSVVIRLSSASIIFPSSFIPLCAVVVLLNIVLAVFNLMPIPPLDGAKIIFTIGGYKMLKIERFFEKYSLFVLLVFVFFLWQFITPLIYALFSFLTGL